MTGALRNANAPEPSSSSSSMSPNAKLVTSIPASIWAWPEETAEKKANNKSHRENPVRNGNAKYSGFLSFFFFTQNFEQWPTKNPWQKTLGKYEKSCDCLTSSPRSKRGDKAFGILPISTTPIFGGLWGHFHVMCAQLRRVGRTTALDARRQRRCRIRTLPAWLATPVSLVRPHAVASIECMLNSMRWSSSVWPRAREVRSRRATISWCTSHVLDLFRGGLLGENG